MILNFFNYFLIFYKSPSFMKPPSKIKKRDSKEIKALTEEIQSKQPKNSLNDINNDVIHTWIKPNKSKKRKNKSIF